MSDIDTTTRQYPANIYEGAELYDDLVEFAGLSHEASLETVGYATAAATYDTAEISSLLATYSVVSNFRTFPEQVVRSNVNEALYTNGGYIAMKAAKRSQDV